MIESSTTPLVDFHRYYEFNAVLPGDSKLEISVFDYDIIGSDDFIGKTVIDLDVRQDIFHPRGQNITSTFL